MSKPVFDEYQGNDAKLPLAFMPTQLISSDLVIEDRMQKELIPREQSSFGNQSAQNVITTESLNSRLTFYVSDPAHYLDLTQSYFTCDWEACAADAAGGNALKACLEVGGIHNVIKTLIIKIGGVQLMRLDDYNKWYNINNLATHSEAYTNFMLGCSGDGVNDFKDEVPDENGAIDLTQITNFDKTNATMANTGIISALATDANAAAFGVALKKLVRVGDLIRINDQYGRVAALGAFNNAAASTITLGNASLAASFTAIAGDNITKLVNYSKPSTRRSLVNNGVLDGAALGAAAVNVVSQKLQWQLPVGAMRFLRYFPLPYLQEVGPLEIEFEFADAVNVMKIDVAANAAYQFGYQLSKPRFVATFVRPNDKVLKIHDMVYKSDQGICLPYVNYRHFRNTLAANSTDAVYTFQTNLSSVRHAFTVLVNSARSDSTDTTAQNYDSQSAFLKSSLSAYRYAVGGKQFPEYGMVNCSSAFSAEAWAQLMLSLNIKENTLMSCRIKPHQWQSTTGDKFIISTPFNKDDSIFTGVSLKNNFLELDIRKTADATAINAHTYLAYDSLLQISKGGSVKVYD